jgi:hypothetical protein
VKLGLLRKWVEMDLKTAGWRKANRRIDEGIGFMFESSREVR